MNNPGWLFLAAVVYAASGSLMTVLLGKRLIRLDVLQFKKEADLRYDLIQVRTRAEPIALLGGERDEGARVRGRLARVVENMRAMIALNRNIAFFTEGFNFFIQLIPVLIVAPLYVRGEVEFGKITQAMMAFATVMNAFSLIVREFSRISLFGAVVERLGHVWEAIEEEAPAARKPAIEFVEDAGRVAYDRLTLVTPTDGRLLLKELPLEVPRGLRLLITGPGGSGRTALLRATAGLWTAGAGRISRPPAGAVLFLPQQPHLSAGSLRDQLLYATGKCAVPDERLLAVLRKVGFGAALERLGGLGAEHSWANVLSLGEQQQLAFARLLLANPRFAFLDEPTSGLDRETGRRLYEALSHTGITYVSVAGDPGLVDYHDAVLELLPGGAWQLAPAAQAVSA
jgi:putative ATP-binding cassette transporter